MLKTTTSPISLGPRELSSSSKSPRRSPGSMLPLSTTTTGDSLCVNNISDFHTISALATMSAKESHCSAVCRPVPCERETIASTTASRARRTGERVVATSRAFARPRVVSRVLDIARARVAVCGAREVSKSRRNDRRSRTRRRDDGARARSRPRETRAIRIAHRGVRGRLRRVRDGATGVRER